MRRHKLAVSIAGVVALAGAGAGLAAAHGGAGSPGPAGIPSTETQPTASLPVVEHTALTGPEQRAGTDAGTIQQEGSKSPDVTDGSEVGERQEGEERDLVEEAGNEQLPGGGHADPPGDVDHQFEGTE